MTSPIDNDSELNWVPPTTLGKYTVRYTVEADQGTFSDDVDIQVVAAPTGPQIIDLESIPSRAAVGLPEFEVAPPDGATLVYPDSTLYPGAETFPGYGLPPSAGGGDQGRAAATFYREPPASSTRR